MNKEDRVNKIKDKVDEEYKKKLSKLKLWKRIATVEENPDLNPDCIEDEVLDPEDD